MKQYEQEQNNNRLILGLLESGRIKVTEDGNVLRKNSKGYREMAYTLDSGYYVITIYVEGKQKQFKVHRIVFLSMYGNIPEQYVVDHIDRNRVNNHPSNLRAIPRYLNTARHFTNGNAGEVNGSALLKSEEVISILHEYIFGKQSQYALAEKYGVDRQTVGDILQGRSWTHITEHYPDLLGKKDEIAYQNNVEGGRKAGKSFNRHSDDPTKSWCSGCRCFLPVENFTKSKSTLNGLDRICKSCKQVRNGRRYHEAGI
jgi:hypothetical protein